MGSLVPKIPTPALNIIFAVFVPFQSIWFSSKLPAHSIGAFVDWTVVVDVTSAVVVGDTEFCAVVETCVFSSGKIGHVLWVSMNKVVLNQN